MFVLGMAVYFGTTQETETALIALDTRRIHYPRNFPDSIPSPRITHRLILGTNDHPSELSNFRFPPRALPPAACETIEGATAGLRALIQSVDTLCSATRAGRNLTGQHNHLGFTIHRYAVAQSRVLLRRFRTRSGARMSPPDATIPRLQHHTLRRADVGAGGRGSARGSRACATFVFSLPATPLEISGCDLLVSLADR